MVLGALLLSLTSVRRLRPHYLRNAELYHALAFGFNILQRAALEMVIRSRLPGGLWGARVRHGSYGTLYLTLHVFLHYAALPLRPRLLIPLNVVHSFVLPALGVRPRPQLTTQRRRRQPSCRGRHVVRSAQHGARSACCPGAS